MKRLFLISITLLISSCSFGQSIVTSNRSWYNFINYYAFPPPVTGTEHIKFTVDTLINSLSYKKVERSLDENQNDWSSYGFIRENSNKQIFYKINPQDTDRLLYDLNVQKYDTVIVYGLNTSYTNKNLDSMRFYVYNIDSTLIGQFYRKRINLTLPDDTTSIFEQWIDSIGSLGGILHNRYLYVGCDYYSLQCFFEDGILKYHDPNYSGCTYISEIYDNTALTPTVTISPNPVSDVSTLELNDIENYTSISISFYNLFGKEVYRGICGKRMKIFKNNFSSGMYFYSITVINSSFAVS